MRSSPFIPPWISGPYPFVVLVLGLITAWICSSWPFSEHLVHPEPPPSGKYKDLFAGLRVGEVVAGDWRFVGVLPNDEALRARLSGGTAVYDVYFTYPEFSRQAGGLNLTWFTRFVPQEPPEDTADFRRAVHVLSVALERGSQSHRPWSYVAFPTNLPVWAYQGALLLLLGALAVAARRTIRTARPGIAVTLAFAGVLAAGLALRLFFSAHAPLHANQHGLEELDHLVFPLNSPYPGHYGSAQSALEDLLFWWLPGSGAVFFGVHAFLGVLAAAGAGLLARSLTDDAVAGWAAMGFGLLSPHLIRVSTSESEFLWVILLLPLALWGLVRYARVGDRLGLVVGGAGVLLVTHLHAVTPVFLALPAAALFMAPRGKRVVRSLGLGFLTLGLVILMVPHLAFLLDLHAFRASRVMHDILPGLAPLAFEPQNLVFYAATGPEIIPLAAFLGLALLWWRRRNAAFLITVVSPLFLACFLLTTCWTDMVRYQAPIAAWILVPAGIGVGGIAGLVRGFRWRVLFLVGVAALTVVSLPCPWTAHLRPDAEAQEYLFLDETAAALPQHGVIVTVPDLQDPPGISSYFPRSVLRQNGLSYRVVDAVELSDLIERGELEDEPLFFYRGLGWFWLKFHALEADPEVEPEGAERSREILAATRLGLTGLRTEVFARHRVVRQDSPVPEHRMDFNSLPGPYVDIEMIRLYVD